MSADHPIIYVLPIDEQRRAWLTVWKCRDRDARKGWRKRDPYILERYLGKILNRHRLHLGIVSIRPGDYLIQQRQILGSARHWPNTGHNPDTARRREAGDEAG